MTAPTDSPPAAAPAAASASVPTQAGATKDSRAADEPATEVKTKPKGKAKAGPLSALDPYLPGRREALFLLGGGVLGGVLGGGYLTYAHREPPPPEDRNDKEEVSVKEAREFLEQGNARFVAGTPIRPDQTLLRRSALAKGQHPFAAILSCADSRVPPEVLFDRGLGDLFVVRSAGQVLDRAVLGSLQYGVEHLKTPLLVVLGHSACGAVKATVESVLTPSKPSGTDIDALVAAILPAVKEAEEVGASEDDLLDVSIQLNVERVAEELKQAAVIDTASALREVKVIGAVYDLKTGEVEWL